MKHIIAALFTIFLSVSMGSTAFACDCRTPTPDMDTHILSRINVAARFTVLERESPKWGTGAENLYDIYNVYLKELYYGELNGRFEESGVMFIKSDAKDGCSRYLEVNEEYNLLLLYKDGDYMLSDQCTELSTKMWSEFQNKVHKTSSNDIVAIQNTSPILAQIFDTPDIPETITSIETLEGLGEVKCSKHLTYCILIHFHPLEGMGYGDAIVYRKVDNKYDIHSSYKQILLPEAKITDRKITITRQNSLNNESRVEVFDMTIK